MKENKLELWEAAIPTSAGVFIATYNADGLVSLGFPSGKPKLPASVPVRNASWVAVTASALNRVLDGAQPKDLPPLSLEKGTTFQKSVWRELRRIPPGETRTYGEIAERLGRKGAARAVGAACGANPIPALIPCHRVLASNRRLGGFSGGLNWKIELLRREGVREVRLPSGAPAL